MVVTSSWMNDPTAAQLPTENIVGLLQPLATVWQCECELVDDLPIKGTDVGGILAVREGWKAHGCASPARMETPLLLRPLLGVSVSTVPTVAGGRVTSKEVPKGDKSLLWGGVQKT